MVPTRFVAEHLGVQHSGRGHQRNGRRRPLPPLGGLSKVAPHPASFGQVHFRTAPNPAVSVCGGCRRATEAERFLRDGSWERQGSDILAFWGNNPEGKTLGIIGYTHQSLPSGLPEVQLLVV